MLVFEGKKGSWSSYRTSFVDQNIAQTGEWYSIDPIMGGTEDVKLLSKNAHNPVYELTEGRQVMDQSGQQHWSRIIVLNDNDHHAIEDFLFLEENLEDWLVEQLEDYLDDDSSSKSSLILIHECKWHFI